MKFPVLFTKLILRKVAVNMGGGRSDKTVRIKYWAEPIGEMCYGIVFNNGTFHLETKPCQNRLLRENLTRRICSEIRNLMQYVSPPATV